MMALALIGALLGCTAQGEKVIEQQVPEEEREYLQPYCSFEDVVYALKRSRWGFIYLFRQVVL